jgi:CO/xanthine dehydrogenase FAD-binding subunit
VQADGSVYLLTGTTENGQGLQTTACLMLAEALGIPLDRIVFVKPQTPIIADGGPTVASRGTLVTGHAIIDAAIIIKERIFSAIQTDLTAASLEETEWKDGMISCVSSDSAAPSMRFDEAVEKAFRAGLNLSAYGWFKGPNVNWEEETGHGSAYFTYVYGCHIAEVMVDTHTGKVEMLNVTAAHEVGSVINRLGAEGQVYGGVIQGIGYGILEDYDIQQGEVKSQNLDTYLIPTIKDVPPITPVFLENPDPLGPFGAKSLGEPTLELTAAATNNALSFALGKRSYQIPLTLERVFLGKNLRKPVRQSEIALNSCKLGHNPSEATKQCHRLNHITTVTPRNLDEALELLAEREHTILSGGTDVTIRARAASEPQHLLNISALSELKQITENEQEISIGGAVSFNKILRHTSIAEHFPVLIAACSRIGSTQVRNRGTVGGNIVNAAPCADSVPPLLLYTATVHLQSQHGYRHIPLKDFIIGQYRTDIQTDEILVAVTIPKPQKEYYSGYAQLGRRNAMNITRLSVSAHFALDDTGHIEECALVDGSLFSCPQRLTPVENVLLGKPLNDEAIAAIESPLAEMIDAAIGGRWSAEYKQPVFIHMCQDVLREIQQQISR